MRSTCRRCGGRGSIITSPCVVCRGAGQAKQKKKVVIPVPAGGSGLLHAWGLRAKATCPCFWSWNSGRNQGLLHFPLHQLPLRSPHVIGKWHLTCLPCSCEKQLLHLFVSQGQRCTHCPPSWLNHPLCPQGQPMTPTPHPKPILFLEWSLHRVVWSRLTLLKTGDSQGPKIGLLFQPLLVSASYFLSLPLVALLLVASSSPGEPSGSISLDVPLELWSFPSKNLSLFVVIHGVVTQLITISPVDVLSGIQLIAGTVAHQAPLSMGSPGKNTGVGCHFLLQGIFPSQGANLLVLHILHWQADSLALR